MKLLIKILIISDDIEKWVSLYKGYHVVKAKDDTTIQNEWSFIRFRSRISDKIVDKVISDKILYEIVAPMAVIPKITYTKDEYRFGKEEN